MKAEDKPVEKKQQAIEPENQPMEPRHQAFQPGLQASHPEKQKKTPSAAARGRLVRTAIQMAWPAVLESFFVALAGMIDTMMVATLGSYAVAAVGLTQQPKFLGLTLFIGMNVAVSALVARRKGEERREDANSILVTALLLVLIFCTLISILCLALASPVMHIAGSNQDTHDAAVQYFRIIMGGMIFNVLSLVINAAQRGSGFTRIAMTTNVTSSIVNVIFNYLLIGGHFGFPALGVRGAALATVLGTVVACIMSIRSLFRKNSYVSVPFLLQAGIRPAAEQASRILSLSSNICLENMAMRIGFVTTAVVAARLGTEAFAAHNVGMNLMSLGFSFADGMQVAAVALAGQALGAGRKQQAIEYGKVCQRIGMAISIMLATLLLFFGRWYYSLYFTEPHIVDMGVLICRFITVIVLLQISQIIYGACLRAAGDVRYTLIISLISVAVTRSLVTIVLTNVLRLGLSGIWIGVLSDQLTRFLLLGRRFRQGRWVDLRI